MSFRNRPVLDRKHRPRWQDELRTQQLTVAGFALAIAIAIGIFAAVAWSSFYNANLRQVALVHGEAVERAELQRRTDLVAAQLSASYLDLVAHNGGVREQVIQQQVSAIEQALNSVEEIGSDSLITGLVLDTWADDFGLSVPDDELDQEIAARRTLPERVQLSIIQVTPQVDEGAEEGSEPTEADWAEAEAEINEVKAQLDGGADFATIAAEHSDHSSAQGEGLIGWISAEDSGFADYFAAVEGAEEGDVVGPERDEQGFYLLRVNEREEQQRDERLADFLEAAGISEADFRAYVRQDLLQQKFQDYFTNVILGRYAPQRHVAQIFIAADEEAGAAVPKVQIRHLLVKPLPDAQDQSAATEEQWAAALDKAEELRQAASQPDADWYALADESDDPGSRTRGGSLGWHDPSALATQFVPEFAEAAAALEVGELSEPVRSEFGYHVIQVTGRRVSATELAERLAADLAEDPDAFPQMARDFSEDPVSAEEGGDLGWVVRYQLEPEQEEVVFAMTEVGEISEPLVTERGTYIFKLLGTSEARFLPEEQRSQVIGTGFSRWLVELEDQAGVWIDPEVAPATTIGSGAGTGTGVTPITP